MSKSTTFILNPQGDTVRISLTGVVAKFRACLAIKEWQLLIRNYFSSVFSHLQVAFFAQDCTVISDSSAPKLSGFYGGRVSADGVHLLFTPSTHDPIKSLCIKPSLPLPSISDNSPVEIHGSPPKITWSLGRAGHDWFGYQKGIWTGLHIDRIARLWVSGEKAMHLKHPSYHISFCPNADTRNICDLVACSTLVEAKKLAEEYYKQWLRVNYNFDSRIKKSYPLAERLEVRHERILGTGTNMVRERCN